MAKLTLCENGHYYDTDKFNNCPYCKRVQNDKAKYESLIPGHPSFDIDYDGGMDDDATVAMPAGGTGFPQFNGRIMLGGQKRAGIYGGEAEDMTVGFLASPLKGNSYITGWLVEVEGPAAGRDYRIYHGNNWLGTDHSMDVIIYEGDSSVAEKEHCAVVYDGKFNNFYVKPGSGGITFLNGAILEEPKQIILGDRITVGNCTFEFIPFCREGYKWNNGEFGAEK